METNYLPIIVEYFESNGISDSISTFLSVLSVLLIIAILSWSGNFLAKNIIVKILRKIVKKTKNEWDDIFVERRVFHKLSHIVPALIIYFTIGYAFPESESTIFFINRLCMIYMVVIVLLVFNAFLNVVNDIYDQSIGQKRGTSIKSYIQVVKIVISIFITVIVFSILLNQEVGFFLTGMGAMSAVLLLIFKDSILGLVGGIQLTSNDMVRIGDWISMPGRNADGTVIEVSLNTVKVQNFDMTISTVPTYALVSESFTNWRGMEDAGGRRIKRSLFVDATSVKFCTTEMIKKYADFEYLKEYIELKQKEIEKYNKEKKVDNKYLINGRRMTNLGTFRAYITNYLKNHPLIHQEMIIMVRQLPVSETGLPLEIYCFTNDIKWINYESIQADIFDHLLAVITEFELKVFQNPSGNDLNRFINN